MLFRQPIKTPHSLQSSQDYVQVLLTEGLKFAQSSKKDLSPEQFAEETAKKMLGFKSPTLEELTKNQHFMSTMESKSEKPLLIGSGPILDGYKGLQETLRKKDNTHTWPEGHYPELTGGKYDRNGNIAFLYAGIAKGKTFEFVTPLDLLLKRAANEFYLSDVGGAFVELVWLLRNGYTFTVDKDGRQLMQPGASSAEFKPELPTMTQKYFQIKETIAEMEKIALIWNKLSAEEVNCVKTRWATDLLANEQYISEKAKSKAEFKVQLADAKDLTAPKQNTATEFKVA